MPPPQNDPVAQALPQRPQFVGSLSVFVHVDPQRACPGGHGIVHAPAVHTWPTGHCIPQPPQCEGEARVSTSHPLAASRSQSAKPVEHVPTAQRPDTHATVAFASDAHAIPHAPQFAADAPRSTSQPFDASMSQSPKPD